MTLFAHAIGLAHLAWPTVGELYLAGNEAVLQLAGFSTYSMAFFGGAILLVLVSLLLFGVAMWWHEAIPNGATALFALEIIPLNLGTLFGYQFESFGGFMLAVSGLWILIGVRK